MADLHVITKAFAPDARDDTDFSYTVECPGQPACNGWTECDEPHAVDGKDANDGPYEDCDEGDPWCDTDEFDFHGVTHTWQYGHGWTVPYVGCVVRAYPYLREIADDLLCESPPGRYQVRDYWDDEDMELRVVEPAEEAKADV